MKWCFRVVFLVSLGSLPVLAQSPANPSTPTSSQYNLTVPSAPPWTDSNIELQPGDDLQITGESASGGCHADGIKKAGSATPIVAAAPWGALIGRIGSGPAFLVGSKYESKASQQGSLYLGFNSDSTAPCSGNVAVKIQVVSTPSQSAQMKSKLAAAAQTWLAGQFGVGTTAPGASPAVAGTASPAPANATSATSTTTTSLNVSNTPLDAQLAKDLDTVPRRVNDQFKNLGDMVNFVIVGPQDKLQSALTAANWKAADATTETAVVNAVLDTYQKKDYLQMPMSILYLFNRPQDFGYELADPYAMVASRHHFRIWKAPFTWKGQPVWIGAGTHDVGFEKDQRNGKVTHKIDPAVDGERTNIGATLQQTGKIQSMTYYLPTNPVEDARNATGGSYHSDGKMLVMFLK